MTLRDLVVEAVVVTAVQALVVACIVAMVAIIGAAFWQGRGTESVWPEATEPQSADVPSSTVFRGTDALTRVEDRNSAVRALVTVRETPRTRSGSRTF